MQAKRLTKTLLALFISGFSLSSTQALANNAPKLGSANRSVPAAIGATMQVSLSKYTRDADAEDSHSYQIHAHSGASLAEIYDNKLYLRYRSGQPTGVEALETVTVQVSDAAGATALGDFRFTWSGEPVWDDSNLNTAPQLGSSEREIPGIDGAHMTITLSKYLSDPDEGDTHQWQIVDRPAGSAVQLQGDKLRFYYRQGAVANTRQGVTVKVTDAAGASAQADFGFTWSSVPDANNHADVAVPLSDCATDADCWSAQFQAIYPGVSGPLSYDPRWLNNRDPYLNLSLYTYLGPERRSAPMNEKYPELANYFTANTQRYSACVFDLLQQRSEALYGEANDPRSTDFPGLADRANVVFRIDWMNNAFWAQEQEVVKFNYKKVAPYAYVDDPADPNVYTLDDDYAMRAQYLSHYTAGTKKMTVAVYEPEWLSAAPGLQGLLNDAVLDLYRDAVQKLYWSNGETFDASSCSSEP